MYSPEKKYSVKIFKNGKTLDKIQQIIFFSLMTKPGEWTELRQDCKETWSTKGD